MQNKILPLLAAFIMLCTGCSTFISKRPERNFPGPIKSQLYGSLNHAENVIKSVGVHKIRETSVTFKSRPGERQFSGIWGWKSAEFNIWVLGETSGSGRLVQVAHAPGNEFAINFEVVHHEFAHHWLLSSGVGGHPHEYRSKFMNWRDPSEVQNLTLISKLDVGDNIEILDFEVLHVSELGLRIPVSVTWKYIDSNDITISCGVME